MFMLVHHKDVEYCTFVCCSQRFICSCRLMGILDKIADIENEIARTQKNKATEYHLGLLKAKLAKYRSQLLETQNKASKGEGFDVMKSGDARVALIGFPSVGKSTLLNSLTSTHSECASYEFTTLTCIPGVIEYKGANIQLLDLPGIIEGASQGKGRGRQVIAVARTADLVLMMLDATKPDVHRKLLENELESVGIRLNKNKPNIYFKQKKTGGLKITSMVSLTKMNEKMTQMILQEYKIFNAEVIFREDSTPDEFIDVVVGGRVYLSCLYVYNKIDQISLQEVDRLARQPHSVVVSCNLKLNLDYLLEKLWDHLNLIQVFTKKRGRKPDLDEGIILRNGSTVEHICHSIHRSLASQCKCALVWGTSVKFSPQHVGLNHVLHHHDVVQIVKK
ncbi:Developmentally-regulated GTP-binding protein isoform 3 [Schistosoma japonicum]|uniref:Developmentally-regulated GTP-binding protein isoform 3 n=1 Tax=Schistosoma japonicum TaxID=6182 RepID=A0A4Z2CNY5_SCHJA|nr:Developmentally-regulated GTP-binding protein 2 [Schistosoma japonicum]TNN05973.1 Developmentally-regulated GTP-binding protein isoform 3 [Schistosoma japonicum]